jgi:hypothetical protein
VVPKVPAVVGTGILIAGGNNNEIRGNRIYDNWRRGTMLISVPEAASGNVGANSTPHRETCERLEAPVAAGTDGAGGQVGARGRRPKGGGKTLPDQRAYDTLDARCRNFYARGFLLYEIYTRAAAFDLLSGGGG